MKFLKITELELIKNVEIKKNDALLIVDMQNDFIPGGALPVEEGDQIIIPINNMSQEFRNKGGLIVLTQDWHPKEHLSFANNHLGKKPGDEYQTEAIGPILWPDHCVQGTKGADFHEKLNITFAHGIIRKGYNPNIDSYSGFLENDKNTETGLLGYLRSQKIARIFICGLALDYCCYFTAMDGKDFGFDVFFIVDMTRGIDQPENNVSNALENMNSKGIKFVNKDSFA